MTDSSVIEIISEKPLLVIKADHGRHNVGFTIMGGGKVHLHPIQSDTDKTEPLDEYFYKMIALKKHLKRLLMYSSGFNPINPHVDKQIKKRAFLSSDKYLTDDNCTLSTSIIGYSIARRATANIVSLRISDCGKVVYIDFHVLRKNPEKLNILERLLASIDKHLEAVKKRIKLEDSFKKVIPQNHDFQVCPNCNVVALITYPPLVGVRFAVKHCLNCEMTIGVDLPENIDDLLWESKDHKQFLEMVKATFELMNKPD